MTTRRRKLVLADFWDKGHGHRPYRGVLRTSGDREASAGDVVRDLCVRAGVHDGDEFEISVQRTGRRPFGDRRMHWVSPHTYERETLEEAGCRDSDNEEG